VRLTVSGTQNRLPANIFIPSPEACSLPLISSVLLSEGCFPAGSLPLCQYLFHNRFQYQVLILRDPFPEPVTKPKLFLLARSQVLL
jgi:hypothetical protein